MQVSTQIAASLPARWRIWLSAVPTNSAWKLRLDLRAGTGNRMNCRTPADRSFSNCVSSEDSVWRELPGKPDKGSSWVTPSARNSGWISWLWPKPISDTMSRSATVARIRCSLFIAPLLLNFAAKPICRQEGAYALFTDGRANHTECIARSAAVPRATDFGVCLQVVVKLGSTAPKEVGPAGQIRQGRVALQPVGGHTLAVRRVVALVMRELHPALHPRKQAGQGPDTTLAEALIAAMHPDAPRREPAPGV